MNIVVVLRAVRDPASFSVNSRAEKIFIHREQFICNPADQNALEAALRMPGGMVTAVSYGGEPAAEVLRMARATGAARAVLAAEPKLQDADAGTVTGMLLAVLRQIEPVDLVVLGDEVLDGDYAQVGPRLAQALDWPFVESAWAIGRMDDGSLKAVVRRGDEYRALGVELPAVVSVPRDSNRVRYAPAGRVITSFAEPEAIESLTPATLGLGDRSASPVSVSTGEAYPPERQFGEVLEGKLAETMATLEAALRTLKAGR
jgi:electron transfer flavoprotein beta subunit